MIPCLGGWTSSYTSCFRRAQKATRVLSLSQVSLQSFLCLRSLFVKVIQVDDMVEDLFDMILGLKPSLSDIWANVKANHLFHIE